MEAAGDGLAGVSSTKPVWSDQQITDNFLRSNSAWVTGSTIPFAFRDAPPPGIDRAFRFVPLSEIERTHTRLSFDLISDLVNLTFVEVPDDRRATNVGRTIYFGKDSAAPDYEWGHASRYTLGTNDGRRTIVSSEVWISDDAQARRAWFPGGYNFQALMHEALHTLGVPHPGAYNADGNEITFAQAAQYAQDTRQFTIMSYFAAANSGADHLMDSKGGLYSGATPLLHDVAVLQALYGANMNTRTGDTVYGYNSTAGRSPFDFNLNTTPIFTIWDAGGVDRLDFSQSPFRVVLDLTPGAFSDAFEMTNNISIAHGVTIEDAVGGSANDRLSGNEASNKLQGMGGDDELLGHGGADHLEGGDGRDVLRGGAGDDLMGGQAGDDFLDGGAGRDVLFGDEGNDHLVGGTEADALFGQTGDDLIGGQEGDDFIDGGQGRDRLFGDAGDDHIIGGSDVDLLYGQDGDDLIGGQDGDDFIDGGQGRDRLFGDAGADHMVGGSDADAVYGGDGDDLIGGEDGDDFIDGGQGRDRLYGDAGNDHIVGGAGADALYGQGGDDLMGGQDGDDILEGGEGRDVLFGDSGDDVLIGGGGADLLFGNAGADLFVFNAVSDSRSSARDRIGDFDAGAGDRVDLSRIDADVFTAGDQAFILVERFTGRAGEGFLAFDPTSNTSTLSLDVDGDRVADFQLDFAGLVQASGFIL
jgi:Ca2+-binding RTX toxin-like protein